MSQKISIGQQIEEVEREIALREGVYKRMVSNGQMRQSKADFFMDRIRAAHVSLCWLRDNEPVIKQRLAA